MTAYLFYSNRPPPSPEQGIINTRKSREVYSPANGIVVTKDFRIFCLELWVIIKHTFLMGGWAPGTRKTWQNSHSRNNSETTIFLMASSSLHFKSKLKDHINNLRLN